MRPKSSRWKEVYIYAKCDESLPYFSFIERAVHAYINHLSINSRNTPLPPQCEEYQHDLRLQLIDHSMTGRPRESNALLKLRKKLEDTEARQDSLKSVISRYRRVLSSFCYKHEDQPLLNATSLHAVSPFSRRWLRIYHTLLSMGT